MSKLKLLLICSMMSLISSSGSLALAVDKSTNLPSSNSSELGTLAWAPNSSSLDSITTAAQGSSTQWVNETAGTPPYFKPTAASSSSSSSSTTSVFGVAASGGGSVITGTSIPSTVTHLVVSNKTASAITIGVQCQLPGSIVQDGCTTSISDMQILDLTAGTGPQAFTTFSSSQGTFSLASLHQYEIISTKTNPFSTPVNQQQNCLQGLIVSFGQWNSCPSQGTAPAFPIPFVAGPDIPNGSNAAEPSLNLPSTINGVAVAGTGSTEVCDITCVNGANSILKLTITSPSSPPLGGTQANPWLYDSIGNIGAGQSFSTSNSWVNVADKCDDNCYKIVNNVKVDRPGVFPYGCTQCNVLPDPKPPCGQFCAAQNGLASNNGCTFNRAPQTANPATARFGGTVEFSYLSKAVPPASCQGLGQP